MVASRLLIANLCGSREAACSSRGLQFADTPAGRKMNMLVLSLAFLALLPLMAQGLRCYSCASVEMDGESLFGQSFQGKTDPNCESASYGTTQSENCPDDWNYRCGLYKASVSDNSDKFTVLSRGCVQTSSDGCKYVSQLTDLAKDTIDEKFIGMLSGLDAIKVSGKACYCNFDNCVAGGCVDGEVPIGPQCVAWYWLLVGFGGLVVVGLLITCCCCCCCSCCRSRSKPGAVITTVTTMPGMAIGSSPSANGFHAISNPGYERLYNTDMQEPSAPV